MIPSIFLQGLGTQTVQKGSCTGKGNSSQTGGFADILGRIASRAAGGGQGGDSKSISLAGQSGLSSLKKELMASGRSLESYTTNGEALSEFGNILVKMGFDSAEVDEMVSTLKNRAMTGKVTLADLFKGASQLTEPDTEALLDVSAMSDLEDILGKLGVDAEMSRRLLSNALVEDGQSIDLKALAAGIRQELSGMGDESGVVDADGILEIMGRLGLVDDSGDAVQATLDELISEVSRFNDLQDVLDDTDGADGLPGSLLISYLQQLTASLGEEGQELRSLIESSGKEDGGFDGVSLLSKLVRMKQDMMSTASSAQLSDGQSGRMNLERFAAILESRVAANNTPVNGTMAESIGGFMENITPSAETPGQDVVFPVDSESDATLKAEWQPDAKRISNESRFRKSAGSASDTIGKQIGKQEETQSPADVLKRTTTVGEADRQFSENASGKQAAGRFSDIPSSNGREKPEAPSNETAISTENLVRDLKAGGETAAMARTDSGRNLPAYLLNQVSRQIVRLRNAGENDITLQLKPPHLGRMKLNIEHTAGGMRVGIVVESSAAKDMLLAHSHDLKASLADQGLRLDRIDVEAQADFGHSMAQADQGFGRFGGGRGRWTGQTGADGGSASDGVAVVESAASSLPGEPGRLDLVA